MKKMLVMEFNELSPSLVEQFIDEGVLPNFALLRDASITMETETDATGEALNPWVQWFDIHTGIDWDQHNIRGLNSLKDFEGKFLWDTLSEKFGLKNWICGSMNAKYSENFKGRFLPDPWCTDVKPSHNDGMLNYYKYVSQSVQSHSGAGTISQSDFAKSLFQQGVSFKTFVSLLGQLYREKVLKKDDWKRAMCLDRIQLDVFKHYYNKEQPQFCTFFSNAVAHFQHHYWSDFEPEKFGHIKDKANSDKANAIREAYKNTDYLVGELRDLVGEDTAILFTTGLSQEPYVKNERHYYHIKSDVRFFEKFNIPQNTKYKPIMAQQFYLEMPDEASAIQLEEELGHYVLDSMEYFHEGANKLFMISRNNRTLSVSCRCTKLVKNEALYFSEKSPTEKYVFSDIFYRMKEAKTGMHNPVGLYWLKSREGSLQTHKNRVRPSQIHHDIVEFFT
jgi:hypothetical protein